ncbi:alkaline phosphatase D family protein [Streptomyces sp. NPDC001530]|uniref:alkaline phosphatase D family protein n=1 Tax=Streptomyces sp. NPDC001530 TaxID=3364582 RepID=UPI00367E3E26
MTMLALRARDYVEPLPRVDAELTVTLIVVAEWDQIEPVFELVEPAGLYQPDGHGRTAPRRDRAGRRREVVTHREREALQPITMRTDALGHAIFDWPNTPGSPLAEAFRRARLQRPGNPVVSVFATFQVQSPLGDRVDSTNLPQRAREDETVTADVYFDLAEAIVGHTTETAATLWFRTHLGNLNRGSRYVCEVREATRDSGIIVDTPSTPPDFTTEVSFDAGWADTATVTARGLTEDTAYQYRLLVIHRDGKRDPLTSGSFRTASTTPTNLRIGFASCHKPLQPASNEAWNQLSLARPDLVLLMGDQIYGDGIRKRPGETWFDSYARRYLKFWSDRPVRNVLRHHPVYMMLDDHDVADDFGTLFTIDGPNSMHISFPDLTIDPPGIPQPSQVQGALKAYQAFQQAHSPIGRNREAINTAVDYSFRRGPVAFYVLDGRTQRGRARAGSPILGTAQRERLRQWATSREARDADVIVLATAVPIAFADVELAADAIRRADEAASAVGAVIGAGIGAVTLGPVGAVAGGVLGWAAADAIADEVIERDIRIWKGEVVEPDLADHWGDEDNLSDASYVLNLLFDLANDGTRPRAVIVLGGDVHLGAVHRIRSTSPRHARNPVIWQFTSSPISNAPTEEGVVSLLERSRALGDFYLGSSQDGQFQGEFDSEFLSDRNFGLLEIARTHPSRRAYTISGAIRGVSGVAMEYDATFDLDQGASPRFVRRPPIRRVVVDRDSVERLERESPPARSSSRRLFSRRGSTRNRR